MRGLKLHHAEHVQGFGVLRLARQNLGIDFLRFGKSPGSHVRHGGFHDRLAYHGRHVKQIGPRVHPAANYGKIPIR